jgi:hypothetical protein
MRLGSHHTLPLREDQIKKLQRGHKKGSAVTIELDPYSCDLLHGSGFFDSIKSAFSHPVTKQIVKALRPAATAAARAGLASVAGPMGNVAGNALIDLANQEAEKSGYGVKKHRKKHYVHHDKRIMDGHIIEPEVLGLPVDRRRGRGFFDTLKKAASSDAAKAISRSLRPMATDYLRSKLPSEGILGTLGHTALDFTNKELEKRGYGVHKKRRGRPRKGGALIAAGY